MATGLLSKGIHFVNAYLHTNNSISLDWAAIRVHLRNCHILALPIVLLKRLLRVSFQLSTQTVDLRGGVAVLSDDEGFLPLDADSLTDDVIRYPLCLKTSSPLASSIDWVIDLFSKSLCRAAMWRSQLCRMPLKFLL